MKARVSPEFGVWEYSETGELRKGWLQFVNVPRPSPLESQVVNKLDPTIVGDTAVETWLVRSKTQEELDADADRADEIAVRALIPDLRAGTGTNADRIARLEKGMVRALRMLLND